MVRLGKQGEPEMVIQDHSQQQRSQRGRQKRKRFLVSPRVLKTIVGGAILIWRIAKLVIDLIRWLGG